MKQFIKTFLVVLGVALAALLVFYVKEYRTADPKQGKYQPVEETKNSITAKSTEPVVEETETPDPTPVPTTLPSKKLLPVPFQSQAPFADWSEPYENGCEEASIIMVKRYLEGQSLSKQEMKDEIDRSVAWQIENWGSHHDLNAASTLKLAEEYFSPKGELIKNIQVDQIRSQIAAGNPLIIPTAGRKLGNPNFRGAGPEYHMLVAKGYNDDQGIFITNDPGTRLGESYTYKYNVLMNAISGPNENMEKTVLVLSKF